jgi:hypothetical protein
MGMMNELLRLIEVLSPEALAAFRQWFSDCDARSWDRQFEADAKAGKLDALANAARASHRAGGTTKL